MHRRLLTRHFLRQFVENDLVSPGTDRHEILSVAGGALIAVPLFVTVFLSVKYLFRPFQSPGWTAIAALDDQFLYAACSMMVMALIAVTEWDALALDWRDTNNLGPLPIPRVAIVTAKLGAIGAFAGGFGLALNLGPSLLHPLLVAAKLPVSLWTVVALVAAHLVSTLAAGVLGFATVLGLREVLRAMFGSARFQRISTIVRAGLFVLFATTFLLMPALSSRVADGWLGGTAVNPLLVPPLWFVGIHETIGGRLLDNLPRTGLPPRTRAEEEAATVLYRGHRHQFHALAAAGLVALAMVVLLAILAFAWNTRTLPAPPGEPRTAGRRWSARVLRAAQAALIRRPDTRAGFSFAIHTLFRSAPHRLSVALSLAVGIAIGTACLQIAGATRMDHASIPVSLLAMQTLLVSLIVAGIRQAMRLPAAPLAGWIFKVAWCGQHQRFVGGVGLAALVAVLVPVLALLLPLHAALFGWRLAAWHGLTGALLGSVLLQASLAADRRLPFVDTFRPADNINIAGPVYALIFLVSACAFSWLERLALTTWRGAAVWWLALSAVLVAVRAVERRRWRAPGTLECADSVSADTRSLGLSE